MAKSNFAVFALKQMIEIVIPTTHIAGLIIGIKIFFLSLLLNWDKLIIFIDVLVRCPAVGAFSIELRTVVNAIEAKDMLAGQSAYFIGLFVFQTS
jgi:hypothetical protein